MPKTVETATATIEGNQLVIRLPLQKPVPSATGKSLVVATTRGNLLTDATVKLNGADCPITIGVNAYLKLAK